MASNPPDPEPTHSRCEDDLVRAARRLDHCVERVEHLQALVAFYQADNQQLRSLLRMKDELRASAKPNAAPPKSADRKPR